MNNVSNDITLIDGYFYKYVSAASIIQETCGNVQQNDCTEPLTFPNVLSIPWALSFDVNGFVP